jgi:outer membrane protein assembly factor BamA
MKGLVSVWALLLGLVAHGQPLNANKADVRLRNVQFARVTQLGSDDLERCRSRLQAVMYDSDKWLDEVKERAQIECWQAQGYFLAGMEATAEEYTPGEYSVVLTVREGTRYRLGHITFTTVKHAISADLLRPLVPLNDGDIFDPEKIRIGIEKLRKAYAATGFINMTSVPDTQIDDDHGLINLLWYVDEGAQFFVRAITIDCSSPSIEDAVRTQLVQKIGDVYNQNLIDYSLEKFKEVVPPRTTVDIQVSTVKDSKPPAVDLHFVCIQASAPKS